VRSRVGPHRPGAHTVEQTVGRQAKCRQRLQRVGAHDAGGDLVSRPVQRLPQRQVSWIIALAPMFGSSFTICQLFISETPYSNHEEDRSKSQ
jgi:hypothetical protein